MWPFAGSSRVRCSSVLQFPVLSVSVTYTWFEVIKPIHVQLLVKNTECEYCLISQHCMQPSGSYRTYAILFHWLFANRINSGGLSILQQHRRVRVPTGRIMSIPAHTRRSDDCLQALAARSLQKRRSMRVFTRIWHDENARVLLLFAFQCVPQQRMPIPAHRSRKQNKRLPVVRSRFL